MKVDLFQAFQNKLRLPHILHSSFQLCLIQIRSHWPVCNISLNSVQFKRDPIDINRFPCLTNSCGVRSDNFFITWMALDMSDLNTDLDVRKVKLIVWICDRGLNFTDLSECFCWAAAGMETPF